MVRSNMAAVNRLQSQILDLILSRIDQVSARELSIPVGSLTGSPPAGGTRFPDFRADGVGRLLLGPV